MKLLILEGLYGKMRRKKRQWELKQTELKVGDRVMLDCYDWKVIKVVEKKKKSIFPKGAIFSEYSTEEAIKEVKKVRPYFECKVVKVKKKKEKYSDIITIDGRKYRLCEDKKGNVYPQGERR